MIKQTSDGLFYVVGAPNETFRTYDGAACHEITLRRAGNHSRPDSRSAVQKMADESWSVPIDKQTDRFTHLESQLPSTQHQRAYDPTLSRAERLRASIKLSRNGDADAEEAAAVRAEWLERPLIKGGLAEAKRLLDAAESDYTRDRGELVALQHLVQALETPGASESFIKGELKRVLGIERERNKVATEAANAELVAAQSKVDALAASQRVAVRVPVTGETLLEQGNSYTANLLAAGASHDQIDAAFAAMDAAFNGDMTLLAATLSANEEAT